jgi:DnaK suppressor protein
MKKAELHRYRNQLLELRTRLRGERERIVEGVRSGEQPVGEHDRCISEAADKEVSVELNEEIIQQQITAALQRIEDGTFGICRDCGGVIAAVRLDTVPYTPHCAKCQQQRE